MRRSFALAACAPVPTGGGAVLGPQAPINANTNSNSNLPWRVGD